MKTLRASYVTVLTVWVAISGCGGGGGGSPATVTDFCGKWAQNVCQISTSCAITAAACVTYQTSQCNAFATKATSDGKRVFTPSNMNSCLDKLKAAYTGVGVITPAQLAAIDTACNYVFQGKVAQLGPETCVSQYDCAGATDGSIICDPTQHLCAKKMTVAAGAQCQGVGYVCPQDSYCTANAGGVPICTAEAKMGESCATIPCDHTTRCVNNTCVVLAQAGEACNADTDCASTAPYCNHYAPSPICSAGLQFATSSPSCACIGQGMSCPTATSTGGAGAGGGGAGGHATGTAGAGGGTAGAGGGAAGAPGTAGAGGGTAGAGGAAGSSGGLGGVAGDLSGVAGQGGV